MANDWRILLRDPRSLALLGEMPQYLAASWTRRTLEQGEFSITVSRNQIATRLIARNTIVEIRRTDSSGVDHFEFAGVIRRRVYDAIAETWELRGPCLKWWLGGRTVYPGASNVDEVQSWPSGTPSAGTFTVTIPGHVATASIAYTATLAQIQSAVNLTLRDGETVTLTGSYPGTVTFTFGGTLGGIDWGLIVITGSGFTSGLTTVTQTTAGVPGSNYDTQTAVPAETAAKHYVANNLTSPSDSARNVNSELSCTFSIESDGLRGETVTWNGRWENLFTGTLVQICEAGEIWHDVGFLDDYAGYQYLCHDYIDATEETGTVPVVFSTRWQNVGTLSYSEEFLAVVNAIYALGAGEGAGRFYRQIISSDSIADDFRRELAIDSRDSTSADLLDQDGLVMIACSLSSSIRLDCQPLTVGNTLYREDWDLGHDVTLSLSDIDIEVDRRIVEVQVALDKVAGETVQIALGSSPRTLARVIAEALRRGRRSQLV